MRISKSLASRKSNGLVLKHSFRHDTYHAAYPDIQHTDQVYAFKILGPPSGEDYDKNFSLENLDQRSGKKRKPSSSIEKTVSKKKAFSQEAILESLMRHAVETANKPALRELHSTLHSLLKAHLQRQTVNLQRQVLENQRQVLENLTKVLSLGNLSLGNGDSTGTLSLDRGLELLSRVTTSVTRSLE